MEYYQDENFNKMTNLRSLVEEKTLAAYEESEAQRRRFEKKLMGQFARYAKDFASDVKMLDERIEEIKEKRCGKT